MKRIIALALATILLLPATGCGTNADGKTDFDLTIGGSPSTLDPQLVSDVTSSRYCSLYTSTLYTYNDKNELLPTLAESYDVSADGLTYTFHLRDGLKWSDGRPLTAKDFVFAFRRLADPKTGSGSVYLITGCCTVKNVGQISTGEMEPEKLGVSAPDDRTLVIELEQPCPYFLSLLTAASFAPCNEDFFESCHGEYATSADTMLSCGAYIVDRYEPLSVQTHFTKNPDFIYTSDRLPDGINIQAAANNQQAIMCFQTGMLDAVLLSSVSTAWLQGDENMIPITTATFRYIAFGNWEQAAIKNSHIRRALAFTVDRETITNNVLRDGSYPMTRVSPKGYYLETDGTDFSADDHQYDAYAGYDPETAKKEWEQGLKELGTNTVEIELAYDGGMKGICEILKQTWEKHLPGLTIRLNQLQTKQWVSDMAKAKHDMIMSGWSSDYADPTTFFVCFKTGSHGKGEYSNPTMDELLDKSSQAEYVGDPDKRNLILHQIEDILMEDNALIPIYGDRINFLVSRDYAGFDLTPTGSGITINSLERRD